MNEEQLANLLTEHLDALLTGAPLPETLPDEVAELLTVAQNLSEMVPTPRPEFGVALKESLLGQSGGGNGAAPSTGSTFSSPIFSIVVIGLIVSAAILALLMSAVIVGGIGSNLSDSSSSTPQSIQTQTLLIPNPQPLTSPTPMPESTILAPTAEPVAVPTLTATPIVDVLPDITVTLEIRIEPPALVPGPSGGGDAGDGGGGGEGDHDQGHGNDPDHNDEDNPGKSGDDE